LSPVSWPRRRRPLRQFRLRSRLPAPRASTPATSTPMDHWTANIPVAALMPAGLGSDGRAARASIPVNQKVPARVLPGPWHSDRLAVRGNGSPRSLGPHSLSNRRPICS
jgi:hypothetical protein